MRGVDARLGLKLLLDDFAVWDNCHIQHVHCDLVGSKIDIKREHIQQKVATGRLQLGLPRFLEGL